MSTSSTPSLSNSLTVAQCLDTEVGFRRRSRKHWERETVLTFTPLPLYEFEYQHNKNFIIYNNKSRVFVHKKKTTVNNVYIGKIFI